MAFSPSLTNSFFLLALLVVLLPVQTCAFGAGDIPDFAYLNDKAFRHGDIENILETLAKSAGGAGAAIGGSSLIDFASSVIRHVKGGSKFSKSDVKKVYFGNWLRDYSQAMDIAGFSKLSADTLVLVVAVLGFMTFGFASAEFEVTADRLGVYLPVEHIDNPKGYAEAEGDARSFHPKLRPPVQERELEIDERTGMKKYIATENQGWDTSTAFIRRTFHACIEAGRRAQGQEGAELWESYRLLGTGLHTMEDLLAHSNWCELALRKMGHKEVFCHVGDRVVINTPNGPAPPLVTGTFGSADFLHSLLGEAGDKLSQASVTDLSAKMSNTSQQSKPDISVLKNILGKFGGGEDNKLNKGEELKKKSQGYNFNPDNVCPPEVQKQLLDLLKWHDDVIRDIIKKIEMVPGLTNLLDEFSNALNEYIYTILAPYLGPILTQATSALNEGSKAVINNSDQYEVFDNPHAHNPSHSLLSKDHFGLILNEPAGKIAQIVVENSVNLIVVAWNSNENPDHVITQILEAFHHPYYATGRSEIQRKMFDHMQRWIGGLGSESQQVIQALTKESVRNHKNKREGLDDTPEAGYGGCGHGYSKPSQTTVTAGYASSNPTKSYGRNDSSGNTGNSGYQTTYGSSTVDSYGRSDSVNTYGQSQTTYSGSQGYSYGSSDSANIHGHGATGEYGPQRRGDDDNTGYASQKRNDSRHDNTGYGNQRRDENPTHSSQRYDNDTPTYGSQRRDDDNPYVGRKRDDDDDRRGSGRLPGSQAQGGFGSHQGSGEHGTAYGQTDTPGHGQKYGRDSDDNIRGHGRKSGLDNDYDEDRKYKPSQPTYGGGGAYGSDNYDSHGKPRKEHGRDDSDDDKKYKSGQPTYGGGGVYGSGDYSGHGKPKKQHDRDDSDDDKKYKSSQGGRGGGGGYGRGESESSTYERSTNDDDDDDRKRRGKHEKKDDAYNQPTGYASQSAYGQSTAHASQAAYGEPSGYVSQPVYGQTGYIQTPSGYAPSYEGRDDTFGAERLNIRGGGGRDGDSDDDDKKKHHKHRGY
ncbi:hypothetical protein GALMADRAFT_218734 [Galerina marginata CBS 339.88]|uniref:Het-C-domain-containing protein n=1 Tax=Galerina marginata (strain CBS 339.88) TaxID=685588 RepID=A0A067U2L4_GALM3|nr:hypothetical protein GALMADRAFT_218734 [Galerina marginata CBS 339.88]